MANLSMVIQALPREAQSRYRAAVRWRTLDGALFGLSFVLAFAALLFVEIHSLGFWNLSVLLVLILAITGARFFAGKRWLHLANTTTMEGGTRLRQRLLRHLISLPHSAYQDLHAGKIGQTLSEDMLWLENFTAQQALSTRGDLAAMAVMLTAVAVIAWPAALAAAVVWAFGLVLMARAGTRLRHQMRQRAGTAATAARDFLEYAEGMQVVRAFGPAGTDDTRFAENVSALRARFNEIVRQSTPAAAIALGIAMSAVATGAFAAILFLPADNGALRTAAAIGLLTAMLVPARAILFGSNIGNLAQIATEALLKIENTAPVPEGRVKVPAGPAPLAFENVSFGYAPDQNALKDVSFRAEPGTLTAIVGPSGAGKTSIANLLLRFWDVSEGRITLAGRDIRDYEVRSYTDRIAPVFQKPMLFQDTIANNIRLGRPDVTESDLHTAARAAQIHQRILTFPDGYDTLVGASGNALSGGERQRITIARAFLKNADIVILDEATSALDPENEREVQLAFEALAKGKTVFMIAHRLSTVVNADNILVLDQGELVAQGRHDELLLTAPMYRALWENYRAISNWTL